MSSSGASKTRARRVIVISGPTAVGKSRLALALAQRLNGEIVSADSVQVYRGLDVGSAKTPLEEREGVPHHLLDIVDPTDEDSTCNSLEYTAGAFFDDARRATYEVTSRGQVPIVVGGTGLYLRWYLNGKPGTPKESPEITAQVDAEVSALQKAGDWDGALEILEKAGDVLTAKSLTRNDWYRLRRALSIIKASGQPRTRFSLGQKPEANSDVKEDINSASVTAPETDYDFLCYFLYRRRIDLYRAIDARCEEMLAAENAESGRGILAEASWLLDLRIQPGSSPPSRAIGYRQAMEYLNECRCAGGVSSEEHFLKFLSSFQQASRNYARRQLTWFRNEPLFQWIDASQPLEKILDFLTDDYSRPADVKIESRVVLSPEAIAKKELSLLKSYVAKNKIFVSSSACIPPILEWIKRTQIQASPCQDQATNSLAFAAS
ncbi:hypothetical protein SELMODRAFT_410898 [Selaginella moellendorffii]|uniref:tRNA dimethylallyltransferase n=1 Tax=Selaginella moellendorffii TaxID=88036 RepID=D8RG81_SELML|nr:hypothetical protein SELMODRAFT_410898 [Selaginella moellendorffii]